MSFFSLFLLAVGLSMDAFAVAVGLWFGGFQALMPLLGYLLAAQFKDSITAYSHWIAFALLSLIGGNMIREAIMEKEEEAADSALSVRSMLPLAIATSIDALAVGVTFAFLDVRILPSVILIGCTTFLLSAAGVKAGSLFGAKYEKKAEILGGVILILLGVKTLLEHLGVL